MNESVARARDYVRLVRPDAVAAFLGGSAATAAATATSDLDIVVVLEQDDSVAYVETCTFRGQLVEEFGYSRSGLQDWSHKGRADRRPVLDRLIAHGQVLVGSQLARELQAAAVQVLLDGPATLSTSERNLRRYALSATRDDLSGAPGAERFAVASTAWQQAAELSLCLVPAWLGTGKWLARELEVSVERAPGARELLEWAREPGDLTRLAAICDLVLEASGGYLQSGFVRGSKP